MNTNATTAQAPQAITLLEFTRRVKGVVDAAPGLKGCWVVGETSDVRNSRHVYLELLEKDDTGKTVARLRATIWQWHLAHINSRLRATGQQLQSGMKVMMRVSIGYSEQYGLSANIDDIYPEFTLGDMVRRRNEILARLKQEGLMGLNSQVPAAAVLQRVAVVSSPTAAGYGDFVNQLAGNPYGLQFYPVLFGAKMQGQETVPTVLQALQRVAAAKQHFDAVVIIRGGGSTTDLNWFDNYDLAAAIARFPLPVITGIGHERDVTVPDFVAARPVKTPTAAAELLIALGAAALGSLAQRQATISTLVQGRLAAESERLSGWATSIPLLARQHIAQARMQLQQWQQALPLHVRSRLDAERAAIQLQQAAMRTAITHALEREHTRLANTSDKVQLLSPRSILNRGFALVRKNGKYVTDSHQLAPGDVVITYFTHGMAATRVEQIKND